MPGHHPSHGQPDKTFYHPPDAAPVRQSGSPSFLSYSTQGQRAVRTNWHPAHQPQRHGNRRQRLPFAGETNTRKKGSRGRTGLRARFHRAGPLQHSAA